MWQLVANMVQGVCGKRGQAVCLLCALAVGPTKVSDDHVVVASLHDTSPYTLTTQAHRDTYY